MNCFERKSTFKEHQLRCQEHDFCKITIPFNTILKFTKYNIRNRIPFVIYGDFEAINIKTYEKYNKDKSIMEYFNIANGDGNSQKTRKIEHQVASSVGVILNQIMKKLLEVTILHLEVKTL
jgi:hypothetical protein